jgi:hypothetical protein
LETLSRAWRDQLRKPASLGIRPWLLGQQFRVLTRIVRQERLLQRLVSTSLEAPVPEPPIYDNDESFWEWFQPDEMVRWEDILSGDAHPELSRLIETFPVFRRWRGRCLCFAGSMVSLLRRSPPACGFPSSPVAALTRRAHPANRRNERSTWMSPRAW